MEREWFSEFGESSAGLKISPANNQILSNNGIGNIPVSVNNGIRIIQNDMYVPELSANLLSLSKMVEKE